MNDSSFTFYPIIQQFLYTLFKASYSGARKLSLFIGYIFVVTLLVAAIIFWIGAEISPKSQPSENKLLPYAGGEKIEHELVPVSIKLFDYALLFIIFEVISLLLVFSAGPFEGALDFISKVGVLIYVAVVSFTFYVFARRV